MGPALGAVLALLLGAQAQLAPIDQSTCDVEKGCFPSAAAKMLLTWKAETGNRSVLMEMESEPMGTERRYISAAFSLDKDMVCPFRRPCLIKDMYHTLKGSDLVIACSSESQQVLVGHNPSGHDATLLEPTQLGITASALSFTDGILRCRFSVPFNIRPTIGTLPFAGLDAELYILLASGTSSKSQLLSYHAGDRQAWPRQMNVGNPVGSPVTEAPGQAVAEAEDGACGAGRSCFARKGMSVSFAAAGDGRSVDVELVDSAAVPQNYLALGFSRDDDMGMDYVVWCNSEKQFVQVGFNPSGTTPTVPSPPPVAAPLAFAGSQSTIDGRRVCRMTLNTSVSGIPGFSNISSLDENVEGASSDGSIGYHSAATHSRSRFNVASPLDRTAEGVRGGGGDGGSDEDNSEEEPPTAGPRKLQASTGAPTPLTVDPRAGCGVSKHCWEPSSAALSLSVELDGADVVIEFVDNEVRSSQYISLAFSDDRSMGQDYVAWCNAENTDLGTGYNPSGHEGTSPVALAANLGTMIEHQFMDNRLTCKFKLKTEVIMQGLNRVTTLSKELYLLYAKGPLKDAKPNTPRGIARHMEYRASDTVYLVTDTAKYQMAHPPQPLLSPAAQDTMSRAHGGLMTFAWLVSVALAILLARYAKNWPETKVNGKPLWFQLHQFLNILGVAMMALAFVMIYLVKEGRWTGPTPRNPELNSKSLHAVLGLCASILGFLQPLIAVIRPHPNTRNRPIFNWVHRSVGFSAWVLALATIYYATRLDEFRGDAETPEAQSDLASGLYIFYLVCLGIAIVGLEFHYYYCEKRSKVAPTDEFAMDARGDNYKPPPRPPSVHLPAVRKGYIRGILLVGFAGLAVIVWLVLVVLLAIQAPVPEPPPTPPPAPTPTL